MIHIRGVPKPWGYPNSWLVYFMENPAKMDDDSEYPYFRKPLCSVYDSLADSSDVPIKVVRYPD